jgi:peptidoglycan/LPS O-acetylase OafA/YrhL
MTQVVCGVKGSWNNVSWSLSAEWFAYLLFPFVLNPIARCPPWLAGVLTGVCLATLAAQGHSLDETFGPLALCRSMPEFLIGMVAWRMFEARFCSGWGWCAIASLAVPVTIWMGAPDAAVVAEFIVLLLSAPNVALLEWRPFVFLGDISYSLYMVHLVTGFVASKIVFGSAPLLLVAGPLLSIGFAWVAYRSFEVPARAKLRAWLGGKDLAPRFAGAGIPGRG